MRRLDDRDPRVLAILLSSLLDFQPGPAVDRRNPLSVRQPAASSWAPSGYELCPDCDLNGMVKRGKHTMVCPRCKGHGCWPVDGYDTDAKPLEVANGHDPARDVDLAIREFSDLTLAEIDKALGRLEQARAKADEDPLWLALERQARYRLRPVWSRQLRRAVLGLEPYQRFLVGWFYVEQVQTLAQARPPFDRRLAEAVDAIGDSLPLLFVAPVWARDQALREQSAEKQPKPAPDRAGRDAMIRAMNENGRSLRQIGVKVGMSQEGVRRVLQRQEREAA